MAIIIIIKSFEGGAEPTNHKSKSLIFKKVEQE